MKKSKGRLENKLSLEIFEDMTRCISNCLTKVFIKVNNFELLQITLGRTI